MQYYFQLWELIGQGWSSSRKIQPPWSPWDPLRHHTNIPVPNYFKNVFQDPEGECSASQIKRKWAMQEIKIIQQQTSIFFPLVIGPLKYREEIKIWFLPSSRMQSSWRHTSSTCEMQERIWKFLQWIIGNWSQRRATCVTQGSEKGNKQKEYS